MGGVKPKPSNPFYHQYHQNLAPHHQIPNNHQRTSPINYPPEVDHPERILLSTPIGLAPPFSTIPPLTPQLKTPLLRPPLALQALHISKMNIVIFNNQLEQQI